MGCGRVGSFGCMDVSPPRPLLTHGKRLWDEIHAAGDVRGNVEPLMILCEQLDERVNLRVQVFTGLLPGTQTPIPASDLAGLRAGLRALDQQIIDGLDRLGLRTLMPAGANLVADDWTVQLAAVRG